MAAVPTAPTELRRVVRSVTEIDALLVLLAVLNYFVAGPLIAHPALYMASIAVYGGLLVLLRFSPALQSDGLLELRVATTGMVVFITAILSLSWGGRGALFSLYLLPVITAALSLGTAETVVQIGLVLLARLFLNGVVDGQHLATLGYALGTLVEAAPVLLVAGLTRSLASDMNAARAHIASMSDRDELTRLLNMQAFTRHVKDEQARAAKRDGNFAVLLIDIDGLKSINDQYGHEAGNRALVMVAEVLARSSRSVDILARYGGDEFLILLSGAGPAIAKVVTNRIRHNLFATTVDLGGSLRRVNVTIGSVVYPGDGKYLRDLINAADRAVGVSKANRRAPFAQPPVADDRRREAG